MSTIILSSFGTLGDALPFARLGHALAGRGHGVTLLSNHRHQSIAARYGLGFDSLDSETEFDQFTRDGNLSNSIQGQVALYRKYFLPRVLQEYESIQRHQTGAGTVIVARATPSIAALFAAEKMDIPVVPVCLAPGFHQSMFLVEELFRSVLSKDINELRSQVRLAPISDWRAWLNLRCRGIGLWPAWFAGTQTNWPEISLTGFMVAGAGDTPPISRLASEVQQMLRTAPPVIISGGTGMFAGRDWYQACVDACRIIGRSAIVITAHRSQVPCLDNNMICCRELPFETVFPHCAISIHHGGIGTVAQALHSGIPQLVLGSGSDRPENARHLIRLGVGAYLPPSQWTPELIARKLAGLLVPAVVERSRTLGIKYAAAEGVEAACNQIESHLAEASARSLAANNDHRENIGRSKGKAVSRQMAQLWAQLSPEKKAALRQGWSQKKSGTSRRIPLLQRGSGENTFPLSFAQERMWLFEQLNPGHRAYVSASAIEITGVINLATLEAALNEVVRRHEVLRTTFECRRGAAVQVVHPFSPQSVEVVDLGEEAPAEAVREELQRCHGDAIDLARGPVFRVVVVKAGSSTAYLLLTIHHIVMDGWGIGLLCQEVESFYSQFNAGKSAALPSLPIQYADYSVWQRETLSGENMAGLLRHWKNQLVDLPPRIVRQGVGNGSSDDSPAAHPLRVSKEVVAALKQIGQTEGVTLFMTILAAFKLLIRRHTGVDDVVVGTDVANRNEMETQRLIGFFVNQLVLRTRLVPACTFRDLLRQVRDGCRAAYAHQDLPFEKLVAALNPDRESVLSPLFDFKFVLQNVPTQTGFHLSDCVCRPFGLPGQPKFPLLLNFWDDGQELSGSFEFDPGYFSRARVALFATMLERILMLLPDILDEQLSALDGRLSTMESLAAEEARSKWDARWRERFHKTKRQTLDLLDR